MTSDNWENVIEEADSNTFEEIVWDYQICLLSRLDVNRFISYLKCPAWGDVPLGEVGR